MPSRKGSYHATPEERRKFRALVDQGLSVARAAERVGKSSKWGYLEVAKDRKEAAKNGDVNAPPPKTYEQLDGGVRDTLRDFLLFRKVFFCRDENPWTKDAASRVVEMLLDKSQRDFVDINCPPGSGKTTAFTHDLICWLICGGGSEDPAFGRALRSLLGHETKDKAIHYVLRLRRTFEMRRPFYDKTKKQQAELVLTDAFGRFRPIQALGEQSVWKNSEFTVAQLSDIDLAEKEPTVQAASRESGFVGERVDIYVWDDLATKKNSSNAPIAEALAEWFEDEAETRLEPGGVGLLVGQRFNYLDLHRNRLDQKWTDEDGNEHPKYKHVIYPAHFDEFCDGTHRQWDGDQDGCLLDAKRLPWSDLQPKTQSGSWETVYQQRDADPEDVLVLKEWLTGGMDPFGYEAPGCYDHERGFMEWPNVKNLIDYVTVDPAAGNYWAIEHWSVDPETGLRYLIRGERKKMTAGLERGFLDWDPETKKHVGLMEEYQHSSGKHGHPIVVWVVEQNAAHRYLTQTLAFQTWKKKWPLVKVIKHETQKNKADPKYGVEALLPMAYRTGIKRLPNKRGDVSHLNYMKIKVHELTTYPAAKTWDTVMADWFGENRMREILQAGKYMTSDALNIPNPNLPYHLQEQITVRSLVDA